MQTLYPHPTRLLNMNAKDKPRQKGLFKGSVTSFQKPVLTGELKKLALLFTLLLTFAISRGADYITLSPGSLSFTGAGGSQTVTISTNVSLSSLSVSYNGCVSNATRSGNVITVTCGVNTGNPTGGSVSVTCPTAGTGISVSQGSCTAATASAGAAMAAICSGGTSAPLGGSVGGSATGGTWSDGGRGGNFSPYSYALNATYTPPAGFYGGVTLTLTTTGGCTTATSSKSITVNPSPGISLSSGSSSQSVCVNSSISQIRYTVSYASGATVSGLPSGVSGSYSSGTFTITGTPTTSGTFNYTVTTTGSSCTNPSASGSITVKSAATASAGAAMANICSGGTSAPLGGSVGGSATGGTWSDGGRGGRFSPYDYALNATYTPPAGFYGGVTLTLTTTGGCTTATSSKSITVDPLAVAPVFSLGASSSRCQEAGSVTYAATATYYSSSITYSLDAASLAGGNTINPSTGTVTYVAGWSGSSTITATIPSSATVSGCSGTKTATHTVTVTPSATASAGAAMASICSGGTSAPLGGSVGGSATGGIWSDGGVGGTFSPSATSLNATWTPPGGYYGNPTLTLTSSGGCTTATASKSISVSPSPGISLSSGSSSQSVCINTAISQIKYTVSYASGATVTGLPSGVTGSYSSGIFTISGTPTTSGTFNYTVTTTSSCTNQSASGSITVSPVATANAGAAMASICQGGTSAALAGSVGGSATGGTWSDGGIGGTFSPSATSLNATWTPPSSYYGTATLTLTSSGGCTTATSSKSITVSPAATASAGAAMANICSGGTSAALGGSVGGSATGGTWSTPVGGSFNPSASTLNATWTPPAGYSGTATLTLTTSGGCTTAIASKSITVDPLPGLSLSAGSSSQSVCINAAITQIKYNVSYASGATVTGLPSGVTGSFSAGVFTISGTPTTSGTFNYTVTTTSSSACTNPSASGTITVSPAATANPGPALASFSKGGTSAALGGSVGGSATTGIWSDGGVGGSFSPYAYDLNATWTPPASFYGPATLTLTTTNGCATATTTKSVVVTIPVSVSIAASANPVCAGTPVTFTATAVNGGAVPTFQWKKNGVSVGTNSSSYSVTPASGDVITCVLTSGASYTTGSPATSNAITMTLTPAATANAGAAMADICPGGTSAALGGSVGGSATTGNWSTPAGGTFSPYSYDIANARWTPPAGFTGSATLTLTTTNGCGTATATKNIYVTMVPGISAPTGNDNQTVCINSSISQVSYSVYYASGATITGLPSGVTGSYSAGVMTISGTPTVSGTFTYTVTATNACTQVTKTGTITVSALPSTPTISGPSSMCAGENVTLTSSSGSSYLWSTGATTQSITVATAGSYTVRVTSAAGCLSASSAIKTVTVSPAATANPGPALSSFSRGGTSAPLGGSVGGSATTGIWSDGGVGGTFSPYAYDLNATWTPPASFYGPATLTLATTNGCATATTTKSVVVTIPVSVSIAASANPVCTGTPVTFTATAVNGGTVPAYQWKKNGVSVGTNSSSYSVTPASGDVITCVLTSGASYTTGSPATSNAITMTVTPSATASAGAAMANICSGGTSAPLGGSVGGSATGGTWSDGGRGGVFSPYDYALNATYTPPAGFYGGVTLTLTTTGGCTTATSSKSITVDPLAVAPVFSLGASSSRCQEAGPVTYAATATYYSSSITYSLDAASLAGGNTINPSTGTVTYVAGWSGSSTITATIPSSATVSGCSGTKTATHTATTTPNNTITLTSGAGSNVQTSCINSAITPVTYTTTGASGATFSGLPSGVTGTWASNTATVSGTPTVSGTFSYSVTLTGGCGTASASGTITVNGLVSPGVSISASATTVCAGSPATFTASPTNGGSSPSYQWKKNGVNVATGSTYTYNPYNGDVITCLMTSNAPCASPATASSNPVTMTVNGLVSPGVSISASATTVCAGSPATFTASPTNGGSSPSYQWKKNGVNVATGSTYTYNPYNGDVITCLMTSNAPCASPATASSNPVTMTVNSVSIATPPVAIEYSNESLTVVGGELAGIGHWAWYDNYKGPARTEQADKINPNPGRSVRYRARAEWDSPQDGSTHSYFVSQKVQKKGESITLPADKNYVVTYSPVVETTSEADLNDQYLEDQGAVVQYFDGLGRPTQSVAVNQSWYFNDLVSGVGYDSFGRQDKTYLPATNHGLGAYVPDEPAFITGFYNNAPRTEVDGLPALTKDNENKERIATQTAYEPSPLNRVTSVSDPAGGVTTYIYGTNTTDEVINFSVEGENCVNKGTYTDNKLYLTQTIDPSGKTVKEYKDKMGKVLLKVAGDAKTYYVYDDFDLLRYVLSPEASAKMNTTGSYTPDHEIIKGLCYYYEYDGRRRMVKKQLPGADPVLMVYDTRDRLVMTQDGKTRAEDPGKWLYTKYEQFNRPVETGWLTTTFDFESLKANFENTIEFSGCDFGEVLTQTLYDSYPNAGLCTLTGRNDAVKGQVTFQKTKILDQSGQYRQTYFFYDSKYRLIQTTQQGGPIDQTTINTYDFVGRLIETTETYTWQDNQPVSQTVHRWFTYDHAGRLEKTEQQIGSDAKVILAQMDYNELGQLMLKKLHSQGGKSFVQDVDYSYNVQGWLTDINYLLDASPRKLYAQQMDYQPNGNISSMEWKNTFLNTDYSVVSTTNIQKYDFTYDGLNRLDYAQYWEKNGSGQPIGNRIGFFDEDPGYDLNGNIVSLVRKGSTDALGTQGGTIDDLTYTYRDNSNQISRIGDAANSLVDHDKQFKNVYAQDYQYDPNGNATFILHKAAFITYNHLNLPSEISNTQGTISYLYDALGNKLKKNFTDAQNQSFDSYYQGSVLLTGGKVIVMNGEGRSVKNGDSWDYEYDMKDHLGNTRVSFLADNGKVSVLQTRDYYPFGLEMVNGYSNSADATKYLYNGKELQDEAGLDFYDYGARFYDPAIGRWHAPDIMSESFFRHSPYSYSFNNPIKYYDPNGMWPKAIHNIMLSNIGNLMTKNDLSILMRASKEADAQKYQAPELSFRHAMGQKGLNDNESIKLYNNFISDQFGKALNAKSRSKGLEELGMALHAIMDNSSPTHNGFQVWKGYKEEENFGATHWLGEQEGAYFDPINRADIILAIQEMKTLYEIFDQVYDKSNLIGEVTVTAKKPEESKSLNSRVEDMLWESVRPNANGNTGRYNKPGRSSDQNYSDDFLKWYYDK